MDDHIAEIHQNPFSGSLSFSFFQRITGFVKLLFYIFYKCIYLAVTVTMSDKKVICKNRNTGNIDYLDIFSLFSLRASYAIRAISFA